MIGPPTDPAEVAVAAGLTAAPGAWALCLGLGVALLVLGRRSLLARAAGGVVLLTAPAAGLVNSAVWGHYPTVDKAGSLHFYRLGAHLHSFDVTAPATQLIGVSMGHLWVTALFDVLLAPFGAMNAQALLNLVLGWWLAARLCEAAGTARRWALVAAMPMGLGLHLFRDVNWYTIEKSGTWALTLFVLALVQAARRGGAWLVAAPVCYFWAFYYNSYWGVLGALVGAAAFVLGGPGGRKAAVAAAMGGLPLVALQLPALRNAQLPPPEAFATRAALDVLSLWPPAWNRLDAWAAFDWVVTGAAAVGVVQAVRLRAAGSTEGPGSTTAAGSTAPASPASPGSPGVGGPGLDLTLAALAGAFALLALGPATPVWGAFARLPGMWRFAKPETFVHLVVLATCVLAGRALSRSRLPVWPVVAVQVGLWYLWVHGHPAYPGFSAPPP